MKEPEKLPIRGLILIVEDNKTTQSILLQMATLIGIDAETADDGLEALEKLSGKKYDVVIMDNEMPKLSGYETTKRVRGEDGLNKNTPIISITANLTDDSHKKYLEAGMSDFLTKPFNILDLQRSIGHWLHSDQKENAESSASQDQSTAKTFQPTPDLQRLERLAGRNPEGFRRFVETFLRDTSNSLNNLSNALSEDNFDEAYRCAHSCSGASSFCGFTVLTELLKKLEAAIAEKDLKKARDLYIDVCNEFSKVENQLAMIH
jgi:two-component system, sensor histidine kinase and response regulator